MSHKIHVSSIVNIVFAIYHCKFVIMLPGRNPVTLLHYKA